MAFKPYRAVEVLDLMDARQHASCSPRPDSTHFSGFSRPRIVDWMLVLIGSLLLAFTAAAQSTQPGNTPTATAHHAAAEKTIATGEKTAAEKTHARRHVHHSARRRRHAKTIAPVVITPVAPPPPVPPAQQLAQPARIEFSQGSLRIDADNSSLVQILTQVSHQTGLKVEGLSHDQRIYGQYGPGPVTATLTKLLDGSGYNYIIVGGGAGHPLGKLLLTPEGNAPANAPVTDSNSTPVASVPENPSEPAQHKTPQQIFEELRRMHSHPHPQ